MRDKLRNKIKIGDWVHCSGFMFEPEGQVQSKLGKVIKINFDGSANLKFFPEIYFPGGFTLTRDKKFLTRLNEKEVAILLLKE